MNLKQFSQITGYSQSTISKAFSGSNEISQETKNIIFDKAKELGIYDKYNKNKYEKHVIAAICPEIESVYYNEILAHIYSLLLKINCTLSISVTSFDLNQENDLISYYSSNNRADGIIVIDGQSKSKKYNSTPIVYINSTINEYADSVNVDFYSGIHEAVSFLKQNGHEKIGFIGDYITFRKKDLFKKAMLSCNLNVNPKFIIEEKKRFSDCGYSAMKKFYECNNMPTAIICAYDDIALGVIDFLEQQGLSSPKDISIVGIDDIKFSSYKKIALSTINANVKSACEIAIDILHKKIVNPFYKTIQSVNVKSSFINRKTVKNLLG